MLRIVALLALVASAVALPCTYPTEPATGALSGGAGFWNGASSIANVIPGLAKVYNKSHASAPVGGYLGQGSGYGIAGVNKCNFILAFSDDPMGTADDSVWSTSKVTIPSVLVSYNFFSSGNKGGKKMALTAKGTLALFARSAPTWSVVTANKGKLNNAFPASKTVIRFGRAGKSGTNQLFRAFWSKAAGASLGATGVPFGSDGNEDLGVDQFAATTTDLCSKVKATPGSIGYAIVGICRKARAIENQIYNKAGVPLTSTVWDTNAAIPRQPPACTASFAAFNLLWNAGPRTPPIASFIYAFARTTENTPAASGNTGRSDTGKAATYNTAMASALLKTLLLNFGVQLQKSYFYLPVPRNLAQKSVKCLSRIKP